MAGETNAGSNPGAARGSTIRVSRRSRRVGLGPRGERVVNVVGITVIALFAIAWSWSIVYANSLQMSQAEPSAPPTAHTLATALTTVSAPTAAYVTDAALEALATSARGASGKLQAKFALPGKLDEALKSLTNFDLITLLPFSAKKNGRVGLYYIGNWPEERGARGPGKAPADRYANPEGFIEVTPENENTRVSEHFRLKDFLTHDQAVLFLNPGVAANLVSLVLDHQTRYGVSARAPLDPFDLGQHLGVQVLEPGCSFPKEAHGVDHGNAPVLSLADLGQLVDRFQGIEHGGSLGHGHGFYFAFKESGEGLQKRH